MSVSSGIKPLRFQLVGHSAQLVVPLLSEASDKRSFKESVQREMKLTAFPYAILADIPAVVVQTYRTVAELLDAYRIQCAGDRLAPCCLPCPESLLRGAETAFADRGAVKVYVIIVCEDAVLAVDNACHEVALTVGICHALPLYRCLCTGGEVRPYGIEAVLEMAYLVKRDRRSGVALYTALSLAGLKVATELFGKDICRDEYSLYLYYHK